MKVNNTSDNTEATPKKKKQKRSNRRTLPLDTNKKDRVTKAAV